MKFDISQSKALVTGGARGIGLELTKQLVAKGCEVVAVGRNQRQLDELSAAFPSAVTTWVADISSSAEVDALVAGLAADHPDINILINNAGVQFEMDLFGFDQRPNIDLARLEIATNFDAVVALTLGILALLEHHERAAIVNISSGLAIAPKAASPVYSATKSAVRSFTKALRYQCSQRAAHIIVVEAIMALVETDMTAGRASRKISAQQAAAEVISGLEKEKDEIWVSKAKLLRLLHRVSPKVAERVMR
ncbi:putative oxidoreductase [Shimia isoporae]|uniref:Putative oxidoreductase n=1 Tax=Shimia isoporae TaxID=647720 RepID=A0A4R1N5H8_9RHOB|nr:SDR family NAD(P)-dependent oxidoreductase [Shimia isoporae]TCK99755.1 putative oxidoreductase [Shimia isoporae]